MKKPNILFIMSDQHNAKVVGHQGHQCVQTPSLDRLATEGIRFDRCIVQNPICTPSRVSFFSGQYCHNHGYYALSGPTPLGLPSVFSVFRSAAYRTAAVGKIHCPKGWVESDADFFEDVAGTSYGGNTTYRHYLEERKLLDVYLLENKLRQSHADPDISDRLAEDPSGYRRICDARPSIIEYEDSPEGYSVRRAIEFMKASVDASHPFFAFVGFSKPHHIYAPADRFWRLYENREIPLPPNAWYDMKGKAPNLRGEAEYWRESDWAVCSPGDYQSARARKLRGYLGNVSHMDHAVGELMAWIDSSSLQEDTIVVYTADHGDFACEHGSMEKAPGISSDAIIRVPLIVRRPGETKAGKAVTTIVESVDLAPTLCALAGIPPMPTADGRDLRSAINGEDSDNGAREGLCENQWSKSFYKDNFHLVFYPRILFAEEYHDGFGELYDLAADPWEMHNLYFDERYARTVNDLERSLLARIITTTRPVTGGWGVSANCYDERYLEIDGKVAPSRYSQLETKHYI